DREPLAADADALVEVGEVDEEGAAGLAEVVGQRAVAAVAAPRPAGGGPGGPRAALGGAQLGDVGGGAAAGGRAGEGVGGGDGAGQVGVGEAERGVLHRRVVVGRLRPGHWAASSGVTAG